MHLHTSPSAWITRFAPLIAAGGSVLDLACGSGRHARWLQAQGFVVTGVDRDAAAMASLQQHTPGEWLLADIEK